MSPGYDVDTRVIATAFLLLAIAAAWGCLHLNSQLYACRAAARSGGPAIVHEGRWSIWCIPGDAPTCTLVTAPDGGFP
jgi:hypothetical protein